METGNQEKHGTLWLRGLLTVAWADGDFSPEEQALVAELLHPRTGDNLHPDPLSPPDLAAAFDLTPDLAEDFLRTAVMVAVADGAYSHEEDQVLRAFCAALGRPADILDSLTITLVTGEGLEFHGDGPLDPVRHWLDHLQIHDPAVARFLCRMIPAQCPFERDVVLFGRKVVHIPPMCKLNPFYEQVVGLRFRALSYLAEQGEDVSGYVN